MDLAYDHIQEASFKKDDTPTPATGEAAKPDEQPAQQHTLNEEIQDAYRAFSTSAWGTRIGGFFGSVVKQGESVYREAQQEFTAVSTEATRGFTDLRASIINRTRSLSLTTSPPASASASGTASDGTDKEGDGTTPTTARSGAATGESAAAGDEETVLSRLRSEAAKRLKDLQRAEDAADEALLRFGTNVRDFLRDAVSIAPGSADGDASTAGAAGTSEVLFESKDAQGKRVIHTSRYDAQLHVIHTTTEGFAKDPGTEEYTSFSNEFDVASKTDEIAADLAKYPELRATMEKLVPDEVPYAEFWKRYYFLRRGIETAEARRRDLLKAAEAEDEVGWGDDDSDDEAPATNKAAAAAKSQPVRPPSTESSTTIQPPPPTITIKSSESRKSNDEKSQADSDASYDVVGATSGVPSQAPSSPKESRKGDDSDEDWE